VTDAARRLPREAAAGLVQSVCRVLSARAGVAVPLEPEAHRGAVDAWSLRARFTDAALHARLAPSSTLQRRLHDGCEQARVEALGGARWPGVAANLSALDAAHLLGTQLPDSALALLCGLRLAVGAPVPSDMARLPVLPAVLQQQCAALGADLMRLRLDQQGFAVRCRQLWELAGMGEHDSPLPARHNNPQPAQHSEPVLPMAAALRELRQQRKAGADVLHRIAAEPRGTLVAPQQRVSDSATAYAVYTRRYDVVQRADALCTPAQRVPLQHRLAQLTARQRRSHSAAALRLQRCLLAQQQCRWRFDSDQGGLDPARLTQVVIDPLQPPRRRHRVEAPALDTQVTLLIDNSGSLRGAPIETAAASVQLLVGLLERCGVRTEVLGYTTVGWRGGQAAAGWRKAGSPQSPGRIAALRHLIYKSAGESAARSRNRLAAMLHDDLLRDNIDGEALQWALQRLSRSPARRRLLLVLCDGEPQEQATLAANDPLYLQRHLQRVLAGAAASTVQVVAIGLHRDVSRCYPQAVVVDEVAQLADVLPLRLVQVLSLARPPATGRRRSRP